MKFFKKHKRLISAFLAVIAVIGIYAFSVNFYIIGSAQKYIVEEDDISSLGSFDCVLVLGCGVKPDGTPSHMLYERVKCGSQVYKKADAKTLLLTGDKSGESYDEPGVMKKLAMDNAVAEEEITIDNIGYSTYESLYNAKIIYNAKRIIVITQPYHLPRALYIARKMGMEAYGVEAYLPLYPRQIIWSTREIVARNKDFLMCAFDDVEC